MDEKRKDENGADTLASDAAASQTAINLAKGAAATGIPGIAAAAAVTAGRKWALPILLLVLPFLIVTMVPTIILGPLFGDGTDTPSGIADEQTLNQNITELNASISRALTEGITDVLERIDADFAASGLDAKEVENPYGSDVVYNANAILSQYCAYKNADTKGISKDELEQLLINHKAHLYSFTFHDETRQIETDGGAPDAEPATQTVRVYTISYNGEMYFATHVFELSDDQNALSQQYAQNLTLLLGDGVYQGLSPQENGVDGVSYDEVVFTDAITQVTYFNQLDKRWKDKPYGTDYIGGYACGPTSMAIVVSSLTSNTVAPPDMAQWAYENGYWCSGNGSYHSLIPAAAQEWGLNVDGCTANEPQRIVDALRGGKLVVAIMGKGHFTRSGHFIVLRGVTLDGKVLVADPASYSRSQQKWDLSVVLDEASHRAGSGGPFWIIGN